MGIAAGGLAGWLLVRSGVPFGDILVTIVTASAFILCGLIVWTRYPHIATGRLLVLAGFASYVGALAGFRTYLFGFMAFWLQHVAVPLKLHSVLSFPSGRLKGGARILIFVTWALVLVGGLATALTYDPLIYLGCECPRPGPFPPLIDDPGLAVTAEWIYHYGWAVIWVALLVTIAVQWMRASPSTRRAALPVWSLTTLIVVLFLLDYLPMAPQMVGATGWVLDAANLLLPFAFLAGLLGMRLDSAGVGRLAIDLAADPRPGRVRYLLAQSLRDPDLGIAFGFAIVPGMSTKRG